MKLGKFAVYPDNLFSRGTLRLCDCGVDDLVERTNRLLASIRPGQLEFNFDGQLDKPTKKS